ncbi:hypothetical protein M0R45_005107 [Rubus argutus]|uniref:Uncharacterized protein n=1 Tax=Rubus argutus TaxID=59490 RepID=A0AAW1YLJ0_RUBAR
MDRGHSGEIELPAERESSVAWVLLVGHSNGALSWRTARLEENGDRRLGLSGFHGGCNKGEEQPAQASRLGGATVLGGSDKGRLGAGSAEERQCSTVMAAGRQI